MGFHLCLPIAEFMRSTPRGSRALAHLPRPRPYTDKIAEKQRASCLARCSRNGNCYSRLPLRELEAAARLGTAVLLALDDARIAREKPACFQRGAQIGFIGDQRLGNAM